MIRNYNWEEQAFQEVTDLAQASIERFRRRAEPAASLAVSAALLFAVFTPLNLVLRLVGRDALRLGFDRTLPTYWVSRTGGGGVRRHRPPRALLRDLAAYFAAARKPWLLPLALLALVVGAPFLATRRPERSQFIYPLY